MTKNLYSSEAFLEVQRRMIKVNVTFETVEDKEKWLALMEKMSYSPQMVGRLGFMELLRKAKDYDKLKDMGGQMPAILQLKKQNRDGTIQYEPYIIDTKVGNKKFYEKIIIFEIDVDIDGKYFIAYKLKDSNSFRTIAKKKAFIKDSVLDEWFGKGKW